MEYNWLKIKINSDGRFPYAEKKKNSKDIDKIARNDKHIFAWKGDQGVTLHFVHLSVKLNGIIILRLVYLDFQIKNLFIPTQITKYTRIYIDVRRNLYKI